MPLFLIYFLKLLCELVVVGSFSITEEISREGEEENGIQRREQSGILTNSPKTFKLHFCMTGAKGTDRLSELTEFRRFISFKNSRTNVPSSDF